MTWGACHYCVFSFSGHIRWTRWEVLSVPHRYRVELSGTGQIPIGILGIEHLPNSRELLQNFRSEWSVLSSSKFRPEPLGTTRKDSQNRKYSIYGKESPDLICKGNPLTPLCFTMPSASDPPPAVCLVSHGISCLPRHDSSPAVQLAPPRYNSSPASGLALYRHPAASRNIMRC